MVLYYLLSKNQNRTQEIVKLNHNLLETILKKLCGIENIISSRGRKDYNGGYEYWMDTEFGSIHFELNKYDKEMRWNKKSKSYMSLIGQNRVKLDRYSKNGYLVKCTENIPRKFHDYLLHKLLATRVDL